jgi:hypothetical protein
VSRLKSAPAAKPRAGARSAPAGARGVYVQAPKSDIYVILLGISLGAILLGCLLLGLVMNRYDFKTKPTASLPSFSSSERALASLADSDDLTTVLL